MTELAWIDRPGHLLARLGLIDAWRRAPVEARVALGVSAAAWIAILAGDRRDGIGGLCGAHDGLVRLLSGWRAGPWDHALLRQAEGAAAMTLAMMLPLATTSLRFVVLRSFPWRRMQATSAWAAGYLGLWFVVLLALGSLAASVRLIVLNRSALPALAFLLAAAWQASPAKTWALNACHRTRPLHPTGLRGAASCFGFGTQISVACAVSCGPMMLAAMASPAPGSAMILVFAIAVYERKVWRPRSAWTALTLVLAGAGFAVLA